MRKPDITSQQLRGGACTYGPEELDLILSLSTFSHGCKGACSEACRWLLSPVDISIQLIHSHGAAGGGGGGGEGEGEKEDVGSGVVVVVVEKEEEKGGRVDVVGGDYRSMCHSRTCAPALLAARRKWRWWRRVCQRRQSTAK